MLNILWPGKCPWGELFIPLFSNLVSSCCPDEKAHPASATGSFHLPEVEKTPTQVCWLSTSCLPQMGTEGSFKEISTQGHLQPDHSALSSPLWCGDASGWYGEVCDLAPSQSLKYGVRDRKLPSLIRAISTSLVYFPFSRPRWEMGISRHILYVLCFLSLRLLLLRSVSGCIETGTWLLFCTLLRHILLLWIGKLLLHTQGVRSPTYGRSLRVGLPGMARTKRETEG